MNLLTPLLKWAGLGAAAARRVLRRGLAIDRSMRVDDNNSYSYYEAYMKKNVYVHKVHGIHNLIVLDEI